MNNKQSTWPCQLMLRKHHSKISNTQPQHIHNMPHMPGYHCNMVQPYNLLLQLTNPQTSTKGKSKEFNKSLESSYIMALHLTEPCSSHLVPWPQHKQNACKPQLQPAPNYWTILQLTPMPCFISMPAIWSCKFTQMHHTSPRQKLDQGQVGISFFQMTAQTHPSMAQFICTVALCNLSLHPLWKQR